MKKWTREECADLVRTSDKALMRALWVIYQNQTADEKANEWTSHNNNKGFRSCDAHFLTRMAKRAEQGGAFRKDEIQKMRWALVRYGRQLAEAANSREKEKAGLAEGVVLAA